MLFKNLIFTLNTILSLSFSLNFWMGKDDDQKNRENDDVALQVLGEKKMGQ